LQLQLQLQCSPALRCEAQVVKSILRMPAPACLPPCHPATVCSTSRYCFHPACNSQFISCCYRGALPPNRSAIAADRASGASSLLIWLASRARLLPRKRNTTNFARVCIIETSAFLLTVVLYQFGASIRTKHIHTHAHKNRGLHPKQPRNSKPPRSIVTAPPAHVVARVI
jgi:hypothetical protein